MLNLLKLDSPHKKYFLGKSHVNQVLFLYVLLLLIQVIFSRKLSNRPR